MNTAVVTGGSRGIGRAIVTTFAKNGVDVVTCATDANAIDELVAEIQTADGSITGIRADVRDEFDVERLMETAARIGDHDGIDCVIANAGVYHGAPSKTPIGDESYSAFDDTIRTNVRGVFTTLREAIPHATPNARVLVPSGSIARETMSGYGVYAVSKAGAEAVARQFAADSELTVSIIDPGVVETELTKYTRGRDPDDVAPLFWWAATQANHDQINGEVVGLQAWKRATQ